MRKINLHLTFIVILLQFMQFAIAQDLDVMEVPKQFKPPTAEILTISLQDVMNSGLGTTGEYWDVITIKENVPCYALSNGTTKIHTLPFLQRLFVNGVEGNFIHVYKPLKEFVLTNNDVEDYGWINKDDLLLWRHSVVTDIRKKIAIKGMILNTIDYIHKKNGEVKINGEVKNDIVPYYLDPTLKKKSGEYSQMFNILYVYDTYPPNSPLEESTSVLLGQSDAIIDVSSIKSNIKGWVPTNRVTFWKHRIAVEMNSDKEAVEERKRNNTPVLIFASDEKGKELAKKYGEMNIPANKVKSYTYKGNFEDERKLGTWMRFPILRDDRNANRYELGVMGALTDETGKALFDDNPKKENNIVNNAPLTEEEIKRRRDSILMLKRNVNIVFVIDGTTSMGPYFSSLSNTLSGAIEQIEASNPKNIIKYGATVYRDAAEGNRLIENSPLNASKNNLIKFLSSVDAKDIKDLDKPEAVFYGLKNAIMSQFSSGDETNIIILVGDAGNHTQTPKTKVDPDFLSNLIFQFKCSVLAYQVHNEGDQTYIDFQNQIKSILQHSADMMYDENKKIFKAVGMEYSKPQFVEKEKNTFVLQNYPPMAVVVTSPLGGKIEPAQLSNNINEIITYSQGYLEKVITEYKKITIEGKKATDEMNTQTLTTTETSSTQKPISHADTNKYVSSYSPGVIQMLQSLNLSNETLKKLCKEKFQLYTKGVAPKQIMGETYPLFKRNLLLSNTELIQIINDIHNISQARSSDERRNAVVDAWIGLLNKYYGNQNEADLKKMKIEEIQAKVFGISSSSDNVLYKYTLQDLMDPAKVTNTELLQYLSHMEKKYSRLKKITDNKYNRYQFYIDEKTFYWISEDYLP